MVILRLFCGDVVIMECIILLSAFSIFSTVVLTQVEEGRATDCGSASNMDYALNQLFPHSNPLKYSSHP